MSSNQGSPFRDIFDSAKSSAERPREAKMDPNRKKLQENVGLRLFALLSGCCFPILVIIILILFTLGPWSLSNDESPCFAVEHPHTLQYPKDPTQDDPKKFLGLEVVNVSARFRSVAIFGLLLYIVLFIFNIILPPGVGPNQYIGYLSMAWFVWLIKARYDHFGRVCSGEYLTMEQYSAEDYAYKYVGYAGHQAKLFIYLAFGCSFGLFLAVLMYTCCCDPKPPTLEDLEEEEAKENKS